MATRVQVGKADELDHDADVGKNRSRSIELSHRFVQNGSRTNQLDSATLKRSSRSQCFLSRYGVQNHLVILWMSINGAATQVSNGTGNGNALTYSQHNALLTFPHFPGA